MSRDFKSDYLSAHPELKQFYAFAPDANGLKAAMETRGPAAISSSVLVEELIRQNSGIVLSEKTNANLTLLEKPGTFTLTTGHQLCICGGPLYVAWKILSVIRLAEELKILHPDKNFVPVFWMATEDHDDKEVSAFPGEKGALHRYAGKFSGAVGRHVIEDSIVDLLTANGRENFLGYYSPGKTWATAARELINDWFGEYGLVIVDGDSPVLKRAFTKIAEAELFEEAGYHSASASDLRLKNLGYELQLHIRQINLFYLGEKTRERIEKTSDGFATVDSGKKWTESQIRDELNNHPENFSPNAALRPLYEEMILPNICYSGGWGEFAYWFQLKPIFDFHAVPYPVLIPRFTATVLNQEQVSELKEMELSAEDLLKEKTVLFELLSLRYRDQAAFRNMADSMTTPFNALSKLVAETDPTLERNVLAEQTRLNEYLSNLDKKLNKAIRNKHSKLFAKAESLLDWVKPANELQERVFDLTMVAPGKEKQLIQLAYSSLKPFDFSPKWILK